MSVSESRNRTSSNSARAASMASAFDIWKLAHEPSATISLRDREEYASSVTRSLTSKRGGSAKLWMRARVPESTSTKTTAPGWWIESEYSIPISSCPQGSVATVQKALGEHSTGEGESGCSSCVDIIMFSLLYRIHDYYEYDGLIVEQICRSRDPRPNRASILPSSVSCA